MIAVWGTVRDSLLSPARTICVRTHFSDCTPPMTQPTPKPCLFCVLPQQRIVMVSGLAMAIRDAYPVSPGHTLIVPKRHVATFFDTTSEERLSMFELLDKATRAL